MQSAWYSMQLSPLSLSDQERTSFHTCTQITHIIKTHHQQLNPNLPSLRDPRTYPQSNLHSHTNTHAQVHSPLMRPGRGQSNKHGVSAVVIRGLSLVRAPLRCFLIVSLRPSAPAFYSRVHLHRRDGRKSAMKERGTEEKQRNF